jgi:D-alanyl-D-alanine carboxypeptidase
VPENVSFDYLEDARNIGFRQGQQVVVEDVLAAMLVYCANDAAAILGEAVEKISGNGFVDLMNKKAKDLGMNNTNYVNATGLGNSNQTSTTEDQLILARAAFTNQAIANIMSQYEYKVKSSNAGLPETMEQYSTIMLPDNTYYDNRVTAVARGSSGSETSILIRAQTDNSDIIIVLFYPSGNIEEVYDAIRTLLDAYIDLPKYDLEQYVGQQISLFETEKDKAVLPWRLTEGQDLKVTAYKDFAFDASKLLVVLKEDSFVNTGNGTLTLKAEVFYSDQMITTVELTTDEKVNVATPVPSQSQLGSIITPLPKYAESDRQYSYSFMAEYGWLVIIAAAAALGATGIILGTLLRKKI